MNKRRGKDSLRLFRKSSDRQVSKEPDTMVVPIT